MGNRLGPHQHIHLPPPCSTSRQSRAVPARNHISGGAVCAAPDRICKLPGRQLRLWSCHLQHGGTAGPAAKQTLACNCICFAAGVYKRDQLRNFANLVRVQRAAPARRPAPRLGAHQPAGADPPRDCGLMVSRIQNRTARRARVLALLHQCRPVCRAIRHNICGSQHHKFSWPDICAQFQLGHSRFARCPLGGPVAKVAPRPNPRDAGFSRPAATAAAG